MKDNEQKVESKTNEYVMPLSKTYLFEGKNYNEIDLSEIVNMTGADMIEANRIYELNRNNVRTAMPEVTLEFACILASKATKQPVEFYTNLPCKDAMRLKNRITGFLFRQA